MLEQIIIGLVGIVLGIIAHNIYIRRKLNSLLGSMDAVLSEALGDVTTFATIFEKLKHVLKEMSAMIYDIESIVNEPDDSIREEKIKAFYDNYKDFGDEIRDLLKEFENLEHFGEGMSSLSDIFKNTTDIVR